MRHQKSGRKFSRTSSHRDAMWSNMVASLILHERIETTVPKAKELRRIAERTISWGARVAGFSAKEHKKLSKDERAQLLHAIRMAGRVIKQGDALEKLFREVAPRYKGRPGGYTRLLKTRVRLGDAAPMSFVELIPGDAPAQAAAPATEDKKAKKKDKAEAAPKKKAKKEA